jgi:hypothetical protein
MYANYIKISLHKMANDHIDDAMFAAASFFYTRLTVVKMMLAMVNPEANMFVNVVVHVVSGFTM